MNDTDTTEITAKLIDELRNAAFGRGYLLGQPCLENRAADLIKSQAARIAELEGTQCEPTHATIRALQAERDALVARLADRTDEIVRQRVEIGEQRRRAEHAEAERDALHAAVRKACGPEAPGASG